jgi:hypothetical protein
VQYFFTVAFSAAHGAGATVDRPAVRVTGEGPTAGTASVARRDNVVQSKPAASAGASLLIRILRDSISAKIAPESQSRAVDLPRPPMAEKWLFSPVNVQFRQS